VVGTPPLSTPAEVRAFPDVPGGVINVPTERTAERSRLGWPRDVNTITLTGAADAEGPSRVTGCSHRTSGRGRF